MLPKPNTNQGYEGFCADCREFSYLGECKNCLRMVCEDCFYSLHIYHTDQSVKQNLRKVLTKAKFYDESLLEKLK